MGLESSEVPAAGPPPAAFNAWFLRRDQAGVLVDALEEELPDGDADAIYMRSGTRSISKSANGWSVCLDDDLEHHAREVAGDHLAKLDPEESGEVPIFWADMRHLDAGGQPAPRNEPCLCGSGRKAKKCTHVGPPLVVGHAYLIASQPEWGAFLAAVDDPRWDGAPELIPTGMLRVALAYATIDGSTLITTSIDAPSSADPADAADHAEQVLSAGVARLLPFLSSARVHMTTVPTDENPGAPPSTSRLVLFDYPPGLADVGAIWWSWVGMPSSTVAEAIPPPMHPDEPPLPEPLPGETKAWIAWGSDGPPADRRHAPPMEDVVAIAVGYSGETKEPPTALVRAHERRYHQIVDELEGDDDGR